jgi:hypothetical protein
MDCHTVEVVDCHEVAAVVKVEVVCLRHVRYEGVIEDLQEGEPAVDDVVVVDGYFAVVVEVNPRMDRRRNVAVQKEDDMGRSPVVIGIVKERGIQPPEQRLVRKSLH